ncbi:ABC transporter ATP-binding protein [Modestobacter lapidis]|nr:ABC transporter ATP-binding protein [Modestobacter lapidis]
MSTSHPLAVADVSRSFQGLRALEAVDLELRRGELLALIGPNGAGKSTLINVITGVYRPDTGRVLLDGADVTGSPVHRMAAHGVSRTFQTPRVLTFDGATALDNLRLGGHRQARPTLRSAVLARPSLRRRQRQVDQDAGHWLDVLGLAPLAGTPAAVLPLASRRLLEIGRAMMGRPQVVLLDEPAAGLNDEELQRLVAAVQIIRDAGTDVLLVEHNMHLIMSIAERIVVLNQGRVFAVGTPGEIARNEDVKRIYLGSAGPPGAEHATGSERRS